MIKAAPPQDRRIDHIDAVCHRDNEYIVFCSLWNAAQKLGYLFDTMMAGTGLAVGQKCLHLVDNQHRGRILHGLIKNLRHLLAGFMNVGASNAGSVNLKAWPSEEVDQSLYRKRLPTSGRAVQNYR